MNYQKVLLYTGGALITIVAGFYALNNYIYDEKQGDGSTSISLESAPPAFAWKFEPDDTLNGDGNPNTNIYLEAKYYDGEAVSKLIDTTHGSCNELPDIDADSVPGSTMIQCYGAGLGFTFKITKGEVSYLVMRKEFEEGSPDYDPPVQKFKVVAEILSK